MRKTFIFVVLLIALCVGINFHGYGENIPNIGQKITEINFTGKWMCLGYNIINTACTEIQTIFEFNVPEKGMVKVYTDPKVYTVYAFKQEEENNRLIINNSSYFYAFYLEGVYIIIEFPYVIDNVLYGFYQVYFFIQSNKCDKVTYQDIENFYNLMFMAVKKGK